MIQHGAILMQDGRPISYATRALTPTDVGYAQIAKEMSAISFVLTKFHQCTFWEANDCDHGSQASQIEHQESPGQCTYATPRHAPRSAEV